ncbi:MAG: hypothetical protein QOF01_393 [Thermomicrobiales bacterium]|nr:hypothetical protein [Thermomicrobiales bacterium]
MIDDHGRPRHGCPVPSALCRTGLRQALAAPAVARVGNPVFVEPFRVVLTACSDIALPIHEEVDGKDVDARLAVDVSDQIAALTGQVALDSLSANVLEAADEFAAFGPFNILSSVEPILKLSARLDYLWRRRHAGFREGHQRDDTWLRSSSMKSHSIRSSIGSSPPFGRSSAWAATKTSISPGASKTA